MVDTNFETISCPICNCNETKLMFKTKDFSYNNSVDMYAFGICLLELLTGESAYKECNISEIISKKENNIMPESLQSRQLKQIC